MGTACSTRQGIRTGVPQELGPPYVMVPKVCASQAGLSPTRVSTTIATFLRVWKLKKENVCGRKSGLAARKPRAESKEQVWNECKGEFWACDQSIFLVFWSSRARRTPEGGWAKISVQNQPTNPLSWLEFHFWGSNHAQQMVVGGEDSTRKEPGGTGALITIDVAVYHHRSGQVFNDHQPHSGSLLLECRKILWNLSLNSQYR